MLFQNRSEAGQKLAHKIQKAELQDPIVLALPRGGVPVAHPIARALHAPLDVLIVRKIGVPDQPELGVGAMTEGGTYLFNAPLIRRLGLAERDLRPVIQLETMELRRRVHRYRQGRPLPDLRNRDVVLVDDGLATGYTAAAAAKHARAAGARRILLASPVCAPDSADLLEQYADEVHCLERPTPFYGVGEWYKDFGQTSDEEVLRLLKPEFSRHSPTTRDVVLPMGAIELPGLLTLPHSPIGFVLFAHGSGSSRRSPRNIEVAQALHQAQIGTLLFDLLAEEETQDRANVFNIPVLAERLKNATDWVRRTSTEVARLPIGYFGASTGGGAALWAASDLGDSIAAVVSRGGRPDLALSRLSRVSAPTLLLVGSLDEVVIELNQKALSSLRNARLELIPGATHLFDEPGTLQKVIEQAVGWFTQGFQAARFDQVSG